MTALPPIDIQTVVAEVLGRAPEWLRRDLSASEPRTREQAEEALAAMISAAIKPDLID